MPSRHPGRTGRPRAAVRHEATGGKNKIPRSFGLTLEAIRDELGHDEATMLSVLLDRTDSPYWIKDYSRVPKTMKSTVRDWETALRDPPFGIEHRFGLASKTWSGVLQLISLFDAELRDAGQLDVREAKLEAVRNVAAGLIRLATAVTDMADNYAALGLEQRLGGDLKDEQVRVRHKDLIRELLAIYRSSTRSTLEGHGVGS